MRKLIQKNQLRTLRGGCLALLAFFISHKANSQQTLTTIGGWNAYVHLPWDYNNNSNTYPTIIFFPGVGEVGTTASLVIANGPGAYITQGWNGNVLAGTDSVKFIVISLQPPSAYPIESAINSRIQTIKSLYRVDNNKLYLTGLSHGGWCTTTFVTGDAYGGPYTYASQVAAVVEVEGVKPDDNSPYPNLFDNFASQGGRLLSFEQANDFRDMQTRVDRMNSVRPNSAIYVQTNFGGGGHCCWANFYGGGGTTPSNFTLDGVSQNLYQWMARQSLTGTITLNAAPVVSAGVDQAITLPIALTTLSGSATDSDGSIVSRSWTQISGPASATIQTPLLDITVVLGLVQGTYKFKYTATDDQGASSSDTMQVVVNPIIGSNQSPSANAGSDATIVLPNNSSTLNGSGNDPDGTISGYQWTKISGPTSGTIANPTSATTGVSSLVQGTYKFRLQVTDNGGATSSDTMTLNVNAAGSCGCDKTLSAGTDGGIYFTNGGASPVQPGQKLCITAGTYNYISLSGVIGTATAPITIINCGGQVISKGVNGYGIRIVKSRYFKFTGTGDASVTYGLKTQGIPPSTPSGLSIMDSTTDYEIDHVELQNTGVGIFTSKPPADADSGTWRQGWTNKNLYYHDNYIHNAGGEAMYLGATSSSYDVLDYNGNPITVEPILQNNVQIYNNIIDSAGWDGIQLASSPNSSIHHNIVTNYGLKNMAVQQSGIIFGGKCTGSVYDNYINTGTGNGMQIFGTGQLKVYNNVVINAGFDGTSTGQDGIIIDDRPQPNNLYSGLQIHLMNNTVVNSAGHCIRVYDTYATMATANRVSNNLMVAPQSPDVFNDKYMVLSSNLTGTINTNNLKKPTIAEVKFVNAASNDYHLQLTSPAIDAGFDLFSIGVTNDMDAVARPKMTGFDVGAYEYDDGNPPLNQLPNANAGTDITISLPTITATLNGSASNDPDGTISTYAWTQISGPGISTIVNAALSSTNITGLILGTYYYQLTVTDNNGGIDKDTVKVTVNPLPNQVPNANAGSDVTITLPTNSTSLNGSLSNDPDGTISTYAWVKISGPTSGTITNASSAIATATSLVQGVYKFQLTVTDNSGATDKDTMQVTVNPAANVAPNANAGLDIVITLPANSVSLSGTGSNDPDGTISTYAWVKILGPVAGTITTPAAAQTTVTGLTQGTYWFQLTVTDNSGATDKDTVQVLVNPAPNQAPTANAGTDKTITLPTNSTTLTGSGTDVDGTIASYAWLKISGPTSGTIVTANAATTNVINLVQGVYKFQLTVTDNNGATGRDTVQVTVNPAPNVPPTANAGTDKTITLPTNTTTLTGSGTDADGTIIGYQWIKVSGPTAGTIVSPTAATTNLTGLVQGVYKFQLTVTDNNSATGRDTVQVTVNPAPNVVPNANAGSDVTITLPTNNTNLNGSLSNDPDGTISTYSWVKISGPATGSITNATSSIATATSLVQGVYKFELTVTDNSGATDKDTMQVTVNPAPNVVPNANAGSDIVITLPTNSTSLNGSLSNDPDGTISTYAWVKISGPATGTITNASSAIATASGLVQGVYKYQLTVTDNSGAIDRDTMQVTVNPAPNVVPNANAGTDIVITLPTNSTNLNGTASNDPDGTISSYAWVKISGPATGSLLSATSPTAIAVGLVQGVYQYQLTVTDNSGATDRDTVKVTVNPAPNVAPNANAGSDVSITLPTNNTNLNGSLSNDPDGTISSYSWVKISGPAAGAITNAASAIANANGLVQGVYQYELTVTDNSGATDKDTMKVTVNPAPNVAPTANAGSDIVITLPVNTTDLDGSLSSDPDGTISSYSWVKISGPATGSIANASSAIATANGLVQGVYKYELTVTDNSGATDKDTMQVFVNAAPNVLPNADAGTDIVITLPTNSTNLNGTASNDPDGTITTYAWVKISGPAAGSIANASTSIATANGLVQGVYQYQLTVTDNNGGTDRDTVQVTVNPDPNQRPIADAGNDITIQLPTNTTDLNGSASSDPDGTISSYSWVKISGPATGSIANASSAIATANGLVQGVYKYELTVTDNNGATDKDTVQVTVNPAPNVAPNANAGNDVTITLPTNSTSLNGSLSNDPDGTITTYAWVKISGPATGSVNNASSAVATAVNLVEGVYQFQLTVTDNSGATDRDTMQVTVNPAPNVRPVSNAGVDQTIQLPIDHVTLNGNGSYDIDGTIVSYQWSKIDGPTHGNIVNPGSMQTEVINLIGGTYYFELTVFDNDGDWDKDTMKVVVSPIPNQAPVAVAGIDQTIILPNDMSTLNGSASYDPDGTITNYHWVKLSGPAGGVIADANAAQTGISNLTQGTYKYELTVTDNNGVLDKDTMLVAVYAIPNRAPKAFAGNDTTINIPSDLVFLNGSGVDVDGQVVSCKWKVISGPVQAVLVTPNVWHSVFNNLIQGEYDVELTVTDDDGALGKDTMHVTVAPARPLIIRDEFTVFPNPVQSIANVQFALVHDSRKIKVVLSNMNGVTVYSEEFFATDTEFVHQIDMSRYPPGTYIINITYDGMKKQNKKIIKL